VVAINISPVEPFITPVWGGLAVLAISVLELR